MLKFYRVLIAVNSIQELGIPDNLDCRVKCGPRASKLRLSRAIVRGGRRAASNFSQASLCEATTPT